MYNNIERYMTQSEINDWYNRNRTLICDKINSGYEIDTIAEELYLHPKILSSKCKKWRDLDLITSLIKNKTEKKNKKNNYTTIKPMYKEKNIHQNEYVDYYNNIDVVECELSAEDMII